MQEIQQNTKEKRETQKRAARAERWRLSENSVSYFKSRSMKGEGHMIYVVNIK